MTLEQVARSALHRFPRAKMVAKAGLELSWRAKVAFLGATTAPIIVTDAHGISVILRPSDRLSARYNLLREDDRDAFRVMQEVLRPGDVMLDVGANVGVYSVRAGVLVGPEGRVYSFEPVPTTLERLRQTIAINTAQNVTVIPKAITNECGIVQINVYEGEGLSGWSTLGRHPMVRPDGATVTPAVAIDVEAETLDEFCAREGIGHVRLCKVDVEGFEPNVFEGATRMLSEQRIDVVLFEISDGPLRGQNRVPLDVFRGLTAHGYQIFRDRDSDPVDPENENHELLGRVAYLHNYFASVKDLRDL